MYGWQQAAPQKRGSYQVWHTGIRAATLPTQSLMCRSISDGYAACAISGTSMRVTRLPTLSWEPKTMRAATTPAEFQGHPSLNSMAFSTDLISRK